MIPKRGAAKPWAVAMVVALASLGVAPPGAAGQGASPKEQVRLVRLPFTQEEGSLTPYTFERGYALVTLVYDTLLWRDSAGVARPWLARSVETSPDKLRLTLHLAPDARWHDGVALTSADVAFTFAFVAAHPHPRFSAEVAAVERVETPDPVTVVIRLRRPSAGFFDEPLADLPILPAHLWSDLPPDRLAPEGLPVGSGPYRLVEHRPGERYRFVANHDFFRGRPAVETIEVPIIHSSEETVSALERHRVDMVPVSLPAADAARLDQLGIKTVGGPSYLGIVLLFNVRRPPFDRPEVRRAAAQALDLGRLSRTVAPASAADRGYLHPESRWAPADLLHRFDAPTARRRLASLAPGPIEVLAPDNDPVKMEAARQVALSLRRVGVSADSRVLPREALTAALGEEGSAPTFQAAIGNTPPLASYDPDVLARLFGTGQGSAGVNLTGYASGDFDRLAERVATAVEPADRKEAVRAELALLAADSPAVPLFFATGTYAFRPDVYDSWVFIKGVGILDKRSFLPTDAQAPPVPIGKAKPPSAPSAPSANLRLWSLGLVAAGVGLALIGLVRRR